MSISAPYCVHGDVYMLRLYIHDPSASEFSEVGSPKAAAVTTWITHAASQIDMLYASVGYEIPFTALSGESWPSYQTAFLKYFNAVGVAMLVGGDVSTPPVAAFTRGGARAELSVYEAEWKRLTDAVRQIGQFQPTDALLRAANRAGSAADRLLSTPSPPLSDFLEGYQDPTRYDRLRDFTRRWQYYAENVLENLAPSRSDPETIEYLQLVHQRLGWTWDADASVT